MRRFCIVVGRCFFFSRLGRLRWFFLLFFLLLNSFHGGGLFRILNAAKTKNMNIFWLNENEKQHVIINLKPALRSSPHRLELKLRYRLSVFRSRTLLLLFASLALILLPRPTQKPHWGLEQSNLGRKKDMNIIWLNERKKQHL